jgi:lipid-binding SYLF domain-containing protein
MQRPLIRAAVLALIVSTMAAASAVASISTAEKNRLQKASEIVADLRSNAEKGIPADIWAKAACVVVIPDMKKAAFIFGGEFGRGVMSCRSGDMWSAPVFMQLAKGSWGFQAGAEEIDLVLLVMNRQGAEKLLNNNVTLGVDASVAAGPVGRGATAATDAAMKAEILAYSRAHGLFAGINISGGALKPDQDSNHDAYGTADIKSVVFNNAVPAPSEASDLLRTLGANIRATSGTAAPASTDAPK